MMVLIHRLAIFTFCRLENDCRHSRSEEERAVYPLCIKIETVGLLIPVGILFSDVARVCSLSLVIQSVLLCCVRYRG